jgi:hypothetical protein
MGQARLPGGERRKAAAPCRARPGAHCMDHAALAAGRQGRVAGAHGLFLREAEDDQVEVLIGSRTYRVRRAEVRSA